MYGGSASVFVDIFLDSNIFLKFIALSFGKKC